MASIDRNSQERGQRQRISWIGMIWLPLGASVMLWLFETGGIAMVFYLSQGRIGVPVSTPFELILV